MFKHQMIVVVMVLVSLVTTNAVGSESGERAVKKFELAFRACEKGLQMPMPKSKGSLTILQNLFKKYQRHRDAALKLDESLKSSEEKRYAGSVFARKTFSDAYQTCEHDFAAKVAKAETTVKEKAEEIATHQAQQGEAAKVLLEKIDAAKPEVISAIDNFCANYLLNPVGTTSTLYSKYQTAKQKALDICPEIVNQFHEATITETGTDQPHKINKMIKAWFDYCDAAFARPVETTKPADSSANQPAETPPSSHGTGATLPQKATVTPPQEVTTTLAQEKETETPSSPKATTTPTPETVTTSPQKAAAPVPEHEVKPNHTQESGTTPTKHSTTPSPQEIDTTFPQTTGTTPLQESAPTSLQVDTPPSGPTPDKDKPESTTEPSTVENATAGMAENKSATDAAADDVAEYKNVMAKMQGDRLKVLKEEKRLPDFVDDEDYNYQKATTWQYEKASGKKCSIYLFKGNQQVKPNKNIASACPPFPSKE